MRPSSHPLRSRRMRDSARAKLSAEPTQPSTPTQPHEPYEPCEPQSADRVHERHDRPPERSRDDTRQPHRADRIAHRRVGVDVCGSHVARAAAPSRARHPEHRLLRAVEWRHAGDASEVRGGSDVESPRVWRTHGLQRGADHLSPADRFVGGGRRRGAGRALARVPANAADDERLRRPSANRARSMARDHRPHAARALRHDGSRHGACPIRSTASVAPDLSVNRCRAYRRGSSMESCN